VNDNFEAAKETVEYELERMQNGYGADRNSIAVAQVQATLALCEVLQESIDNLTFTIKHPKDD
jgi:hypothetical protein